MIDVGRWQGLDLIEPLAGGNRNPVWRGRLRGAPVVVRRSRRPPESLAWELDLLDRLVASGFIVPKAIPTDDGERSSAGVVVQTWIEGRRPSSDDDWHQVAAVLRRLHMMTGDHTQRPGCTTVRQLEAVRRSVDADLDTVPTPVAARLSEVFDEFTDVPTAVIHGDPGPDNIRIGPDGSVRLLDWDESRVDLTWLDLANLGTPVLDARDHRRAQRLADAWEAVNGWTVEPEYARRRLRQLDSSIEQEPNP